MSNSRVLSIAILTVISVNVFSQNAPQAVKMDTIKKIAPLPSLMAGIGVLYFNGNIGHGDGITAYSTVRGGYTFGIEERPIPMFGIQLDGTIGKLAASERSDTPSANKNFQSNIVQGDLDLYLHFFNKPTSVISPFIYAGISFMSYHAFTDSLSAAGTPYYYWTDGSIRNEAQTASDVLTAKIIQRDYTYETSLGSGTAMSVPIGIGAKLRLTDNLCVNIQASYYLAFSKSIEHYTTSSSANEKYLYSFCTFEYHFTRKVVVAEDAHYRNVDFSVIDTKDNVQKSELTKDQEQALLDKEAKNAKDTMSVDHSEASFFADPNSSKSKQLVQKINNEAETHHGDPNKIPARIRAIDKNHDGFITSQEISEAIDDFFNGTSNLTIADINFAIDYFFDQSP